MEKNITEEQTMTLLRRVQHFQILDGGKHDISIRLAYDEGDGKLWFTYSGHIGEQYLSGSCYYFWTYEENVSCMDKFIESFNK